MPTALVVDDSPVDRHRVGSLLEKLPGWQSAYATDGHEALDVIARQLPDVVLTDLRMPSMDGLALVEEIKRLYPSVPVIAMTAFGSEEIALLALERGAASYVPKRNLARRLSETVLHVLEVAQTGRGHQRVMEALIHSESHFVVPNDLTLIPPLVGHLRDNLIGLGVCDANEALRVGVAIREALVNAIVHGNLELGALPHDADHDAIAERQRTPPYADRRVHLSAKESPAEVVYLIRDEGRGFDPSRLPDARNPANLEQFHDRGLRLIHTFMDEVRHNQTGNEITMIKRRKNS